MRSCAAGDMALLEQVKALIPRLTYQQIQDNPFSDGAVLGDVSEDAQVAVHLSCLTYDICSLTPMYGLRKHQSGQEQSSC